MTTVHTYRVFYTYENDTTEYAVLVDETSEDAARRPHHGQGDVDAIDHRQELRVRQAADGDQPSGDGGGIMTRDLPTALARMVIAEAWRRHLEHLGAEEKNGIQPVIAPITASRGFNARQPPPTECIWCGQPYADRTHYPYCSHDCGARAAEDSR